MLIHRWCIVDTDLICSADTLFLSFDKHSFSFWFSQSQLRGLFENDKLTIKTSWNSINVHNFISNNWPAAIGLQYNPLSIWSTTVRESRCFLEQETCSSLLSTGWSRERIKSDFISYTSFFFHWTKTLFNREVTKCIQWVPTLIFFSICRRNLNNSIIQYYNIRSHTVCTIISCKRLAFQYRSAGFYQLYCVLRRA